MPLNLPGPGPLVQQHHPSPAAGALIPVTPDTGINATSAMSATVSRLLAISGTVNATSSVSATVSRLLAIRPTGVNATSAVSATVSRLLAIRPAAVNATSAVTGSVKKLAAVIPATVTATSNVSGLVIRRLAIAGAAAATSPITASVTLVGAPPAATGGWDETAYLLHHNLH